MTQYKLETERLIGRNLYSYYVYKHSWLIWRIRVPKEVFKIRPWIDIDVGNN